MEVSSKGCEQVHSLLDVRVIAREWGCSTRHIQRMAETGRMPAPVKLGTLTRWRRDEIQAWIAGGCKPITSSERSGAA